MNSAVKEFFIDLAATVTGLTMAGIIIHVMKGKAHHWGKKMHGHNPDGTKAKKSSEESEEEENFEKRAA